MIESAAGERNQTKQPSLEHRKSAEPSEPDAAESRRTSLRTLRASFRSARFVHLRDCEPGFR
jgi:hypothetical protein